MFFLPITIIQATGRHGGVLNYIRLCSKLQQVALLGFLLFLTQGLPGCTDSYSHKPLRVGVNSWVGYAPLFLGSNQQPDELFRIVQLGSTTEVMNGLRYGTLEAAALTLDETLMLASEGIPLTVVAVLDISHGGDAVLVKPDIDQLADLAGKTLAVEESAVGGIMLQNLLKRANLTKGDLNIHYCAFSAHIQCFMEADALITFEPVRSRLIAEGARVVFDSSMIPDTIMDLLVIRADKHLQIQTGVQHLVQAQFNGLALMEKDIELVLPVLAAFSDTDTETYRQSLTLIELIDRVTNRQLLASDTPGLLPTIARIKQLMIDERLLPPGSNPVLTLDGSYLGQDL